MGGGGHLRTDTQTRTVLLDSPVDFSSASEAVGSKETRDDSETLEVSKSLPLRSLLRFRRPGCDI